jgi:hypothetical protein
MDSRWIADGGASTHMTANLTLLREYEELMEPVPISTASDEIIYAVGTGEVECLVHNGDNWGTLTLPEVCHVPDLGKYNLFSLGKLADEGLTAVHSATELALYDKNKDKITDKEDLGLSGFLESKESYNIKLAKSK